MTIGASAALKNRARNFISIGGMSLSLFRALRKPCAGSYSNYGFSYHNWRIAVAYQHDIFISYRRDPETFFWITEHFVPLLKLRVGLELQAEPRVFLDDQIESGTAWPASLGRALGGSRTLIALWSGNYLSSVWCTEELGHMVAREKEERLRTTTRPYGVIIPAFIHDGERFPHDLKYMQYFEIQKCFSVRMARNSPLAEELDIALVKQAPAIAACIREAPAWRKAWAPAAAAKFYKSFHQKVKSVQKTVPRFTSP